MEVLFFEWGGSEGTKACPVLFFAEALNSFQSIRLGEQISESLVAWTLPGERISVGTGAIPNFKGFPNSSKHKTYQFAKCNYVSVSDMASRARKAIFLFLLNVIVP